MTRAQVLVTGMLLVLTALAISTPSAQGQCSGPLQHAKLTAADASAGDSFGSNVSIFGDMAVIGAHLDDDAGISSGSAYVFHKVGGTWQQVVKLTAADTAADDRFGSSVSINGNTAIIGATQDDDGGSSSGSAYIFGEVAGAWHQIAKLTAADAMLGDFFGGDVSLSGDTAVIGAPGDDGAGSNSGSAYIFCEIGGVWQQIAKLTASDAAAGDNFGNSVSISGITAVVGAVRNDDAGTDSGSAYIFRNNAGVWNQFAKLTASDAAAGDLFGFDVSVSGDTAVIGASFDDDTALDSGSAYVFRQVDGVWQQAAKLTATDAMMSDFLGVSVSISGDTAVIGASFDDETASDNGSAYVFREVDGVWQQTAKLIAADMAASDFFGVSVCASGNTVIIGSHRDDDGGGDSGSAYIFGGVSCDADGDGVLDPDDICPNNAPGLPVSCVGRPLRDCNNDCLYNAADIQCLVDEMLSN